MSLGKNIVLALSLALGACGGSSSETPFPLEPDFAREKSATGPGRQVVFSGRQDDASAEPSEPTEGAEEPAAPTWGAASEPATKSPREPSAEPEQLEAPEPPPKLELKPKPELEPTPESKSKPEPKKPAPKSKPAPQPEPDLEMEPK